jgi:arsenate reductase
MFGIRTCDTVRKARAWLEAHTIEYTFHDYKSAGIDRTRLEHWCREHGWEIVLNRAGTTFRKLPEADKQDLTARTAVALMLVQPSMIKRPVLQVGSRSIVGFTPERYAALFG